MAKIYSESGFVNWDYLYNECRFLMMVIGGRGTGKTYGLLKKIREEGKTFLYVRRLQSQIDVSCAGGTDNPFSAYNKKCGDNVQIKRIRGSVRFYIPAETDNDEDEIIGYAGAISTIAGIRGVDYSNVEVIIFDEAIPLKSERKIKNEARLFKDLIETVNRNRELEGHEPVKVFMLGNANKLSNPYFVDWDFMGTALKMIAGRQMMYRTSDNKRIIVLLLDSPITERKRNTALYSETDSGFFAYSLDNAFETDQTKINAVPLKDLQHVVSIGTLGIYRKKSDGRYYCSSTISKTNYFEMTEIGLKMYKARYPGMKSIYIYGLFDFESYQCELLFRELIES